MKNIFQTLLTIVLLALSLASCNKDETKATCTDGILNGTETEVDCGGDCDACGLALEGVYKGYLRATADNNIDNVLYETQSGTLTISEEDSNEVELNFVTDNGSTIASGTSTKNSSFYTLDITNVYEIQSQPTSWEMNWPDGGGTFDYVNNNITITLTVDDSQSIGGTNAMYFFEGEQE